MTLQFFIFTITIQRKTNRLNRTPFSESTTQEQLMDRKATYYSQL